MQALDLLLTRQSFNQLTEPAPEGDALQAILDAGVRAPDHGALTPWRFIVFSEAARNDLGEIYAEAAEQSGASDDKVEKAKNMPLRAPLVIAIIADVKPSDKIPRLEQVISAGCAVQAMQMAAFAQGFDGIWRTGEFAYHPYVKQQLKLKDEDEIVGYLYLGTAKQQAPTKQRPSAKDFTQVW
ncbi:NAD(P)H nitroreductase [Saccharobesus litoralis]|uniref:Putative NAD(P)H nitroreductase n=1 Tax=Saccharobesus litoralis TaxID=2172099 RepID=A0A2S0VTX1_9ALTE|nr:NAD(P)H nitroreductase [Saccharobesus litoralis]AWB67661.1 NAD(P)H nitroreductase [Saccharobesus litoralis]